MDAKTAEALEYFKNIIVDAAYEEYLKSGAGLKLTRSKKETKPGMIRRLFSRENI